MNLVELLVLKLIRKIKGDNSYRFNESLLARDLLIISFRRLAMTCNGFLFCAVRFRRFQLLFIDKNVQIKHAANLRFLSPLTLGRGTIIDCLSAEGVLFGKNVSIPENCYIRCTGVVSHLGKGLTIGNNTGLGHNNFINAQGGVVIGNDVIIGPNVSMLSENHKFGSSDKLIRLQGVSRKGINISDNVWIGANVTILDGVSIGKGCVIGAHSVVTKSIPDLSVAVGNPCRIIRKR